MTPDEARAWGAGRGGRVATRDFPPEVLALVDEKQGGRFCVPCRRGGLSTPADEPLEVDHLQPLARGGDNRWTNLEWKCRGHNRGKGARAASQPIPPWARGLNGSRRS